MWMRIRNTFIIFIVSGFWHGANWTFVFWGLLNALYIMPSIIFNTNRNNLDIVAKGRFLPTFKEFSAILLTFSLTVFAWIFFRAENLTHAFSFISEIFSGSLLSMPDFEGIDKALPIILLTGLFLIIEWLGREQQYAIAQIGLKWNKPVRWTMYYALIFLIFYFTGNEQEFIYFQF
jgi:D-alanyl-lipoteichoic acid acyltransferase DltB (MBOAT superfamily)